MSWAVGVAKGTVWVERWIGPCSNSSGLPYIRNIHIQLEIYIYNLLCDFVFPVIICQVCYPVPLILGFTKWLALIHDTSLQSCPTLCDPIDGSPPAPLSLGFSRQEHWSGLPFPSPMHKSEIAQSCPTLSDPRNCNLPGSSIHGILWLLFTEEPL